MRPYRVKFGVWRFLGRVDVAIRRRVNILCVQETKWKGQKAKEVEVTGFKLWYTGETLGRNGGNTG